MLHPPTALDHAGTARPAPPALAGPDCGPPAWPGNGLLLALAHLDERAIRAESLDGLLHEACRTAGAALHARSVHLLETQPDGHTLRTRATLAGTGPHPRTDLPPDGTLCRLAILGNGGRIWGELHVEPSPGTAFGLPHVHFLRALAGIVAAAIERDRVATALRLEAERNARLLRELQHRVKNNMATIGALVQRTLRTAARPETRAALRRVGDGIEALRIIHERIYEADQDDLVPLGPYLAELVQSLLTLHHDEDGAPIGFVQQLEPCEVPADTAIPLGLVASEFVTNAIKHAFPQRPDARAPGTIGLGLRTGPGRNLHLELWDDGIGLPARPPRNSGLRLIEGLARQVGAHASWDGPPGTRCSITLPLAPPHGPS